MTRCKIIRCSHKFRLGITVLFLVASLCVPAYSWIDAQTFKVDTLEVAGVSGLENNVQYVYGRFIILAPYAPTKELNENSRIADLDNNYLLVVDAKKVDAEPIKISLGNCYYPRTLHIDEKSGIVFVRGTEFVETPTGIDSYEVIAYLFTNLGEDGKPAFDPNVLSFRMKGRDSKYAPDAPDGVVLGQDGRFLVFQNGTSIYTYSLVEGYLYEVPFISSKDYDAENNSISHLGIDPETNVLSVVISKKTKDREAIWKHSSEIYFYSLNTHGTLDLIERVTTASFPVGVVLSRGSNVAITQDVKKSQEKGFVGTAYFIGADGFLYEIGLGEGDLEGVVERLSDQVLQGFVQDATAEFLSPVLTTYEFEGRRLTGVKQGTATYINRPLNNGKLRRINRPLNARLMVGQPAVALVQLGKKNKVTQKVFTDGLEDQGGLLAMIATESGEGYYPTRNGKLFAIDGSSGVESASMTLVGQIASDDSTIDDIYYFPNRESFVALNSFEADEEGTIIRPGSLLIARKRETGNFLIGSNLTKFSWPVSSFCSGLVGSIRRPCNIRSY